MMSRFFANSNPSSAAAQSAEGMRFCAANRIMMILDAVILASILIISIVISIRLRLVIMLVLGLMGALLAAGRIIPKDWERGLSA